MASNLYMNVYYDYNRAEQYILQAEKIASDHGYDMQLADIYENALPEQHARYIRNR